MEPKDELQKRFADLFPTKRLLAIQLNGFSHRAVCDNGHEEDEVEYEEWSAYTDSMGSRLGRLFEGFSHFAYQGNPIEYVYVLPSER